MFISNRRYDRLNARNVELAREVRDLNEENRAVYEENRDLRFENEELRNIINKIYSLSTSNTYNNEKVILTKIREVITDAQINK